MTHPRVSHEEWLARFDGYLHQQGYHVRTMRRYRTVCRQFLQYLHAQGTALEQVDSATLEAYVQCQSQRYVQQHGRAPHAAHHRFNRGITGLRAPAPIHPFRWGLSLYAIVARRLPKAGVRPAGKRGPHTFRHAHADSLLRAAVPLKAIGDLLGHTTTTSTAIYLKLATEDLREVGLAEATLTIRDTKFFKSRRLPLQPSVLEVLRTYLQARAQSHAAAESTAALFWNEHKGCGYHVVTMGHLLAEVIRRADLKPATGRLGPRFHDLRHSFVVHRMLAWYRAGINPQSRLHYLATYLGHKDVYSTLVYLTITQDLLQEANARFHTVGAHVLQPARGDRECHSPPLSPSSCIPSFTTG